MGSSGLEVSAGHLHAFQPINDSELTKILGYHFFSFFNFSFSSETIIRILSLCVRLPTLNPANGTMRYWL